MATLSPHDCPLVVMLQLKHHSLAPWAPSSAPKAACPWHTHNTFKTNALFTQHDFFLANGIRDNYTLNGMLSVQMCTYDPSTYDIHGLAQYHTTWWDINQVQNPQFYFGPTVLLLFSMVTFLYKLSPSLTIGIVDQAMIMKFFGVVEDLRVEGGYAHVRE